MLLSSIFDLFCIWVFKSWRRYKQSIYFLRVWSHLELQREVVWFYYFYSLACVVLNWVKSFVWVVHHSYKSDSCVDVQVSFTCCVESIFLITFDLSSSLVHSGVWFYHIFFENWGNWAISNWSDSGMVSSIGGQNKLIAIPKLPDNFCTDNILSFRKLEINWANLTLRSWFRSHIPHFVSFFL